ncbi:MAG: hypothetical protein IJ545_05835 [Alphaproteobacteria bacterium]|nr:hypothetical protein [Alphaproteobacteria bacterium]
MDINSFHNTRYDYILIWGNGLPYKDEILSLIENNKNFEIIKILSYKTEKIDNLVEAVYAYDYAPIEHLKSKIQYLYKTPKEVLFVFIKNLCADEDYLGNGPFRHLESITLKKFKEFIRDKFNERKSDRRTENHVIHASDNQKQTDYILKFLGYKNGLKDILHKENIVYLPYHISHHNKFRIFSISIDDLYANILYVDENNEIKNKALSIKNTPHYKTLERGSNDYNNYLKTFTGKCLQDGYSLQKFLDLSHNMIYPYNNCFIAVKKENEKYIIQDGVHRAAILKYRNVKKLIVVEIL